MNDLRDRMAEALYQWTLKAAAGGRLLIPQHEAIVRENSAARAEVCAAVVQPALDAKDAEIKRLRSRERIANQHARRTDAERAEADARTARAEARYAELEAMYLRSVADLTERAEDAEAVRRDWQMAAQTAENELARLRAYHQQIGDQ